MLLQQKPQSSFLHALINYSLVVCCISPPTTTTTEITTTNLLIKVSESFYF